MEWDEFWIQRTSLCQTRLLLRGASTRNKYLGHPRRGRRNHEGINVPSVAVEAQDRPTAAEAAAEAALRLGHAIKEFAVDRLPCLMDKGKARGRTRKGGGGTLVRVRRVPAGREHRPTDTAKDQSKTRKGGERGGTLVHLVDRIPAQDLAHARKGHRTRHANAIMREDFLKQRRNQLFSLQQASES